MQLMNDLFTGHLSKYGAKVVDEDVRVEFVITHISKNEPDQNFLENFDEAFGMRLNRTLDDPQWDNIKFSTRARVDIEFDGMDPITADITSIKITQKETPKDLIFKYDITFTKKQEKDIDTYLATYLKRKEEDEDGKNRLVEYDIEIKEN